MDSSDEEYKVKFSGDCLLPIVTGPVNAVDSMFFCFRKCADDMRKFAIAKHFQGVTVSDVTMAVWYKERINLILRPDTAKGFVIDDNADSRVYVTNYLLFQTALYVQLTPDDLSNVYPKGTDLAAQRLNRTIRDLIEQSVQKNYITRLPVPAP